MTTETEPSLDARTMRATRRTSGSPQMSRSCLGRPRRLDVPAARMMPATVAGSSGGVATDRSASFRQRSAGASLPDRDDLGHDADRHLVRTRCADVEADWPADA